MNPEDMLKVAQAQSHQLSAIRNPYINTTTSNPSFSILPVKNGYVVTWNNDHYVAETLEGVVDVIKRVQVTSRVSV